ncbi:hypothetical protein KJ934_00350 [Patescibacteria group bacterium]|nr:hypothetical protein [Patescibacteria group bacterium]MBU4353377.1 hypothetical protein [Patescibacteria group bacterium]MBU4477467.1 hypothetical protein [Patescibacteria group bacterium]MCG2699123.1 hypothetical protein [Candidatus Parcubacteria bacterium]
MDIEKQLSEIVDVLNKINRSLIATVGFEVYTDATRPAANTKPAGYTFFNSSDNFLNTSDGTDWRNQSGVIT